MDIHNPHRSEPYIIIESVLYALSKERSVHAAAITIPIRLYCMNRLRFIRTLLYVIFRMAPEKTFSAFMVFSDEDHV